MASLNCFAQSLGSQPLIKPVAMSTAGLVIAFFQATLWGIGVKAANVAKTTTIKPPRTRPNTKPKKRSVRLKPADKIIFCTTPPNKPQTIKVKTNKIKKLNPKMVGVARAGQKGWGPSNKYPSDLVLLDGPEVTMYLLRESAK